jgi:hypothetical protein
MQQPFQDLYADLPPPPVFGTSSVGTFGKTNSISLDDVFQDAFFSEDGELLDIGPSGEAQPPPTQSYVQQQEQPYQSMPIGLGSTAVGSNLLQQQQQQQQQQLQTAPSALTSSLYAGAPAAAPAPQRAAPQHTMGVTAAAAAGLLTEEQKLERRERNREHAKV